LPIWVDANGQIASAYFKSAHLNASSVRTSGKNQMPYLRLKVSRNLSPSINAWE
jgi:hypothetical protein